jgi:hypothetical protein
LVAALYLHLFDSDNSILASKFPILHHFEGVPNNIKRLYKKTSTIYHTWRCGVGMPTVRQLKAGENFLKGGLKDNLFENYLKTQRGGKYTFLN